MHCGVMVHIHPQSIQYIILLYISYELSLYNVEAKTGVRQRGCWTRIMNECSPVKEYHTFESVFAS